MSGFLDAMAQAAHARVAEARRRVGEPELSNAAANAPAPRPLQAASAAFGLIAEIKLRGPSSGALARHAREATDEILERARSYAAGGAEAISVLTEPRAFDGSLEHLRSVAATVELPVMRKDFLVDPYQVLEARAAGASGVLLIPRALAPTRLHEMLACSAGLGMFVLIEAFDERDLETAHEAIERGGHNVRELSWIGVNARDLRTLDVDPERLARLAAHRTGARRVAESGLDRPEDCARAARAGYRLALIGTALMRADDPAALIRGMTAAGRAAAMAAVG